MVTDSITGALLNNVTVEILSTPVIDSTILTGEYKTGLADPGLYSVKFTKAGYIPKTISNVTLTNGVLTILDVPLWDGTVGIADFNNMSNAITISPNPFKDYTTVTLSEDLLASKKNIALNVTDLTGSIIKSFNPVKMQTIRIDGNNIGKGIYFYSLLMDGKTVQNGKLVFE